MARINATNFLVYKDNIVIAHSTDASIELNLEMQDASTKNSNGYREVLPGQISGSGSVNGLVDYSATYGAQSFASLITSRSSFTCKFNDAQSGGQYYSATAYVSKFSLNGPAESPLSYSVEITLSGAITITSNP